ncbi:MAG: hypothetical protein V3S46_07655, partial [Nitrospinota bacterium]
AEKLNGDAGKRPLDEDGFIDTEKMPEGVFAAGVAKRPLDVNLSLQDATGAALSVIQVIHNV